MSDEAVTVTGIELQRGDYRPVRRFVWPDSFWASLWAAAPWTACIVMVLLLPADLQLKGVIVIWAAFIVWQIAARQNDAVRMQAAAGASHAYEAIVDAKGIRTASDRGTQRWLWRELALLGEDRGRFFYGPAKTVLAGLIPKRCMSDEEIAVVRGLFAAHGVRG